MNLQIIVQSKVKFLLMALWAKKTLSIVSSVAMYDEHFKQKSLQTKQMQKSACPACTHCEIFHSYVEFPISWIPIERTGFCQWKIADQW